ncbi:hypothetical protein AcW1_000189 [Taiwanofungus camphoratus]|nr:hypothetical protein AcW2_001317 [Antrodia cinnamomea]KAI0935761.1 hypothetical protein AcV5_004086 [Antrodia cinnamomea]KAI0962980.1 hypothetical protein AcW1_000189 [Antrodia cinnamomea]
MASLFEMLEDGGLYPSEFTLARFFSECVHKHWPTKSSEMNGTSVNSFERVIAVRKLDTEIEGMVTVSEEVNNALSHTICKVKRHRNSAAPVNGLPVELLSEIFLLTNDAQGSG